MTIPTINFADSNDQARRAALETALADTGFMAIRNIGITTGQVSNLFREGRDFFGLQDSTKQQYGYRSATDNFGYQAVGMESLDPNMPADLKETFTVRNPPSRLESHWPSSAFRHQILSFYQACLTSAQLLQRDIAAILGLPEAFFSERITGENVTLRFLHYPCLEAREDGQLGAGAHTDYGLLTFLFQDQVGGLEVQDRHSGDWIPVPPEAGSIVVNTGDMMERWTNGRFASTLHRVQPRNDASDRYSIALFFDPDDEVSVECLPSCMGPDNPARYPPTTAGEHLLSKLRASHRAT